MRYMAILQPKLLPRANDSRLMALCSPLLAIGLTLLSGAALFALLGHHPLDALYCFFVLPLLDTYGWTELGVKTAPLLLCAVGLLFCFKAKVWNIGAEGQFIAGALGGGYAALQLMHLEGFWVLPLVVIVGAMCGLLWAGLAAWLLTRFAANEILTTIMLNYIALHALLYAVHGPLMDPQGYQFPESELFSDAVLLPVLFDGYRLNVSILLGLLCVAVVWTLSVRTLFGYQIAVLGHSRKAAGYAGFEQGRLVWAVLLFSGACAGLAGVTEVTGAVGQLTPYIAPGYGYTAIIVVFLGRMHPLGIVLASMLLALTYLGGEMAQMELGLPKSITGLFQGLLLFFVLACDLLIRYRIVFKPAPSREQESPL